MYDVAIVGAGVIGSMIARELARYQLKVCVLEKENDVACGASKANSGIVHGGYDPEPGTLKAKLNIAGVEKLFSAANELNAPIKRNGSIICAFNEDESKTLQTLFERGITNGVPNMKLLNGDEVREIEPYLSKDVVMALHVPTAGIVCPYELTIAAMGNAMDNGVELKTNFSLCKVQKTDIGFDLIAENGDHVEATYVINCAGCYADQVARMIGDDSFTIIPRAGEYMLLDKVEGSRVSHTIFQVPSKEGKGILVSPTVDGNLLTGPTAGVVQSASCTETTPAGLETVARLASKSVPSVNFHNVITSFSGVRSSEKNNDFIIEESTTASHFIHVAAIDSPGLTSCVAIAEYVVDLLKNTGLSLLENSAFNGYRDDPHAFKKMSDTEKDAFIKAHPAYGKMVCRCEGISEGEIRDAITRNPRATDIDGVKRRTRSGMGRCQGGFCGPTVMRILAEENNLELQDITKKGDGSGMIVGMV